MRLFATSLVFSMVAFGQSVAARGGKPTLQLPVYTATTQAAETITVPITADMVTVLESVRSALNKDGATGADVGYPDRASLLTDIFRNPGFVVSLAGKLSEAPAPPTITYAETLSIPVSTAIATELETVRLNLFGSVRDTPQGPIHPRIFTTKEDLFRAMVKVPGGPLWTYAIKFPTASLRGLLVASSSGSPEVFKAIQSIVQ